MAGFFTSLFRGLNGKIQLIVGSILLAVLLILGSSVYYSVRVALLERYKAELKNTTNVIYQMTSMYTKNAVEDYLTTVAQHTRKMVAYYYGQYQEGNLTEEEAYNRAKDLILDPDYGKIGTTGYLAGVSSKGILEIHPKSPGADASGYDFMKQATSMKNGYIEYEWKNPDDEEARDKAGAMAYFEPWDIIIWASSYKNEFSHLMNVDDFAASIKSLTIGRSGYAFIMDSRGKLVSHPTLQGRRLFDNLDKDERYYFRDMTEKEEGHVVYPGEDPDKTQEGRMRMAYYRYLPDLGWYIFSSASMEEVRDTLAGIRNISIIIGVAAFLSMNIIVTILFRKLLKPISKMKEVSDSVAQGNLTRRVRSESRDEIGEMSNQFNALVDKFEQVLKRIKDNSRVLLGSVQDLSVSSQEISSTSNQQAAAVKEIVSTMEDSDELSKSIASKIDEVTKIAYNTKEAVEGGFTIIKQSLDRMNEIKDANSATIEGIRSLGEKINSIWEIVNIINGIADQTKIIAFNAELEASAAGEAGKNFQIVAGEIRRLADSTVSSTNEIKTKINEIQHSSDNLIIASEEGTEKVTAGWQLSNDLRSVFEDILSSSEISAKSAEQIAMSINQQVSAFEQILQTLKQISEGIDNFVTSTKSTTKATEELKTMADVLNGVVEEYTIS